jgi:molybdopterin/thiamine biosynthesis adenylyltransferase
MNTTILFSQQLFDDVIAHLYPGDHDEHGAVIAAGVSRTTRGVRFLAREAFFATEGIDYVPGQRGYRMLTADFVRNKIRYCRDNKLAYLAVHNHGGDDHVAFSPDDMASHERGYPALVDIARGQPVGALVFARNAIAGDIWYPDGQRTQVDEARVLGRSVRRLHSAPKHAPAYGGESYDRQARLFGVIGQQFLAQAKVGVIGAGGVGSLLVEYLAKLGVGHLIVADPDRIAISNLSRVVGATRFDTRSWLTEANRPNWLRTIGRQFAATKVDIARRVAKAANRTITFDGLAGDFVDDALATRFRDCDFLFLAADSMQARLVFNALVHQYLIPGVQVGSKVPVDKVSGEIGDVFGVCRSVSPDLGCLWCNGVISAARLQEEAASSNERRAWAYVDDPTVVAPSVITLNAVPAAEAVNDFLFWLTGLTRETARRGYTRYLPRTRTIRFEDPRADEACPECGRLSHSRRARGDSVRLPTR